MTYNVNVESISIDINDQVRGTILQRLEKYDFPYVTSVTAKSVLKKIFQTYFENKESFSWLKGQISSIAKPRGVVPIAMTETNRLHTGGLADILLAEGEKQCTTIHSYGDVSIAASCIKHIHEKTLDIKEILENSFPNSISGLNNDVPMIPQHPNCRHVMAPLPSFTF